MKSINAMNQSSLRMIQFPNCKINLGLSILAKRADGYHELETVFYPIAISDALEILPSDNLTLTKIQNTTKSIIKMLTHFNANFSVRII